MAAKENDASIRDAILVLARRFEILADQREEMLKSKPAD
jgi:hypothetical protein